MAGWATPFLRWEQDSDSVCNPNRAGIPEAGSAFRRTGRASDGIWERGRHTFRIVFSVVRVEEER